jgi:hypothetical protein
MHFIAGACSFSSTTISPWDTVQNPGFQARRKYAKPFDARRAAAAKGKSHAIT